MQWIKKKRWKIIRKKNIEKGEQYHAAPQLIVVKTEIIMHGWLFPFRKQNEIVPVWHDFFSLFPLDGTEWTTNVA